MELYQLRTFLIVATEQNITRVAKRLFTTPPSVSAHIKSLEEEWNVSLFRRTAKGMEITRKGEQLRVKAEATLLAAQNLANNATELQNHLIGTLSIGLNGTADFLQIPTLLNRLRKSCPGVELRLSNSTTGCTIADIGKEKLDAGFVYGSIKEPSIAQHHLATVDLVVAVPSEWRFDFASADWRKIATYPWVCSNNHCPFQSIVDALFEKQSLTYERCVHTDDDGTKAELVSAGVGIALMEKSEAERLVTRKTAVLWKTDLIQCDLSLAYLRARKDDPLLRAFQRAVLDVWDVIRGVPSTQRQCTST